ncbi:hypothetical protein HYPSUDRAFT_68765 [Hypholoma sublateritium FD-334 SS-4]|uniref:Uncharacterized protein n=1 Tax=Hypholoma sublateritium (strain FD-334 SS-4) TaxID=945553 RepID=A0A0D2PJ14_HYPSF|nr:hypothetical protein HYPSUDRAFT_68765 [Hypholoma sublateritium FD-334 SS-4]
MDDTTTPPMSEMKFPHASISSPGPGIRDLAQELIEEILSYYILPSKKTNTITRPSGIKELSKHDLAELRLVCQGFRRAVDPYVFSEIDFDFGPEFKSGSFCKLQKAPKDLEILNQGANPFCRYAKTLRINYVMRIDRTFPEPTAYCSSDTIFQAIISLKNVRVVHWDLRAIKFMDAVINGLTFLAHFEELHIDFAGHPFTDSTEPSSPDLIPFHRFRHLHSIAIGGVNLPATYAAGCVEQLHAFVNGGGELTCLALALPVSKNSEQHLPLSVLHDIYHNVPLTSFPPLRNLRLAGYSLQLDAVTIPHLRGLTALDIAHVADIHVSGVDSALWRGLKTANIRLKELVVEAVTAPLLVYLSSYTGLEQLTANGGRYTRVRLDMAAEQRAIDEAQRLSHELCCRVLPLHSGSLVAYKGINTVTTLAPSYMTYESMRGLSACRNLQSIAFTLNAMDLYEEYRTGDLKEIISVALALPHVSIIQLVHSTRDTPRQGLGYSGADRRLFREMSTYGKKLLTSLRIPEVPNGRIVEGSCTITFNGVPYIPRITKGGFVSLLPDM